MGSSLLRRAAATASFAIATSIIPLAAGAQVVVRGVLYDDATGVPIRGTVMLVDPATDAAVVHAATDSLGYFNLQTSNGVYQIAAVRPGYKSVLSAPVTFQNGERVTIRLPIAVDGDPQHHIGVVEHVRPGDKTARATDAQRTAMSGFEGRRATGTGVHFDRARLEKSQYNTVGEFLRSVPGVAVRDPASGSSMQMTRSENMTASSARGMAPACHVGWFVDGHRMDIPGRSDPITEGLGNMQLSTIEALEVFRGLSEMPAEFAAPDLRCGAIAVWTRKS
jgi:hypothetical protein